ncbi:hypothetical protein [Demequina iriomotensis]|uniref:hypothetical protein n=1 Tax=Demequina iriomotensis TaxID=1536641 RepID=UPI000783DE89|nr:hypothetical protein [Demequina iriomotensis]
MSDEAAWHEAWERTLAELELDVDEAERMLAAAYIPPEAPTRTWRPPVGIGPMPASLEARARALLARQVDVSARLAAAASDSRRHGRAISQLTAGASTPPVYVDIPA